MHCTLVTCRPFYRHGPLAPDDRLLEETLTEAGVEVQVKPWEEPWNKVETDLTLVRSTWNYYAHAPAFLAWASSVATCTTLLNPLPILQWNSHKAYLAELERLGFPIIPTIWLPRSRCAHLASLLQETGWPKAVLKPCVSANSYGTRVVTPETLTEALVHLIRFSQQDMMLQPYLSTLEQEPEHSHVFLNGKWSHAFQRIPFRERSAQQAPEEPQVVPSPDEIRLAQGILDAIHRRFQIPPLLTARIDLVRDEQGVLRVMEVECIEPMLHLEYGDALRELTTSIVHRLQAQERVLSGKQSTREIDRVLVPR